MRIPLSKNTFNIIPEGFYIFKITGIDTSKYEKFGRLGIEMETREGAKHVERFSLTSNKGEINEGAVNAFSYFARTALNDYKVEDIDPEDLIGHYIRAEVKHVKSDKINDKTGKPYTNINLGDKEPAIGFDGDDDSEDDDELEEMDE